MRGLLFSRVKESFVSVVGVAIDISADRMANITGQVSIMRDAKGKVLISLLCFRWKKDAVGPFQSTAGLPSYLMNNGIVFFVEFRDKFLQKESGDFIGKITTLLEARGENRCLNAYHY